MISYYKFLVLPVSVVLVLLTACGQAQTGGSPAKPEVQASQPVFQVVSLSAEPNVLFAGDNLTVKAGIVEVNKLGGTYTAVIKIDDQIVGQQNIDVPAGVTEQAVFVIPQNDPGQHQVSIGDQSAKFTVNGFDTQKPVTIQYDHLGNGVPDFLYDGRFAYGGWGQMVRFTAPAYPFKLTAIYMSAAAVAKEHGPLTDKVFTINIWDDASGSLVWTRDYPWALYDSQSGSPIGKEIQVPGVIVDKDFNIEVVTNSDPPFQRSDVTSGLTIVGDISAMALDYETTKEFTRSAYSYHGNPASNPTFEGNWFMRAIGYGPIQPVTVPAAPTGTRPPAAQPVTGEKGGIISPVPSSY